MLEAKQYIDIKRIRMRRAPVGQSRRITVKLSISPETQRKLADLAPYGRGKYGSAVIDLAVDLLYELITEGNDLDLAALRLKEVANGSLMLSNAERLLRLLSV